MKYLKLFEQLNESLDLKKGNKYEVLIDTYISYWKQIPGSSGLKGERTPLKKGDIVEYIGNGGAWGHDDVNVAQFKAADGTSGELAGTGLWGQLPNGVLKLQK